MVHASWFRASARRARCRPPLSRLYRVPSGCRHLGPQAYRYFPFFRHSTPQSTLLSIFKPRRRCCAPLSCPFSVPTTIDRFPSVVRSRPLLDIFSTILPWFAVTARLPRQRTLHHYTRPTSPSLSRHIDHRHITPRHQPYCTSAKQAGRQPGPRGTHARRNSDSGPRSLADRLGSSSGAGSSKAGVELMPPVRGRGASHTHGTKHHKGRLPAGTPEMLRVKDHKEVERARRDQVGRVTEVFRSEEFKGWLRARNVGEGMMDMSVCPCFMRMHRSPAWHSLNRLRAVMYE